MKDLGRSAVPPRRVEFVTTRDARILVLSLFGLFVLLAGIFGFVSSKYLKLVDRRLLSGPFSDTYNIYAEAGYDGKPRLVTNVAEQGREKRRLVSFQEIPAVLVQAVTSAEDKRFFEHPGFDLPRIAKAAWVDLKAGRKRQGASTLTMQLARSLWLDTDKKWSRKLSEMMITMMLEDKLTKQQIFEYYANQIYLGRRGTYSIHGFGEAAYAFFGKDLKDVNLPEAALLAGVAQRPGYSDPRRYPERARVRRNIVLALMRENGHISEEQYRQAAAAPVEVADAPTQAPEAPYFLDLVNNELNERFASEDTGQLNIYTTLDMRLQRAATEAVEAGMKHVDRELKRKKIDGVAQVALIALDPHTGEVKAVVGGRDYSQSQLNRALARRQPGSVFKPFVYAAALNATGSGGEIFTPATALVDEPTTFNFGRTAYEPGNYGGNFSGTVTLRSALVRSLNVPTVKLAEMVGYKNVVALARNAGLNDEIRATPSMALGSYDATPLEIAGAYTVFANNGTFVRPTLIREVRTPAGKTLYSHSPDHRPVLNPQINYLMVTMLADVMNWGTGSRVGALGFMQPSYGKTGTSHDGWFAGFTNNLLCIVWVGFDDYRELKLEGSQSALPVWVEFMKRASKIVGPAKSIEAPAGLTSEIVCADSGKLPGPFCPKVREEIFLPGTEPIDYCDLDAGPQWPGAEGAGTHSVASGPPSAAAALPASYGR